MGNRRVMLTAGMLALALLVVPGCVSKSTFQQNLEDTDARVTAVESAVEANGSKIDDLGKATDKKIDAVSGQADQAMQTGRQALTKATAAEKAAQGKLLWTVTITDDQVKFDFGKAELNSGAISTLDKLVGKAKSYGKAVYFEIEGHTDNVGAENLNYKLGLKRAMAVRDHLHQNGGVPLHAINLVSFGETRPVADNSSKEGRAQNRRVVIRVLE